MANPKHFALLQKGVAKWNRWRAKEHILPDLLGAGLGGADLLGADLHGADFGGANLLGARLSRASLGRANLSGANLRVADLRGADLRGADLSGANLREADLHWASIVRARLQGADVTGAKCGYTTWVDVDLSETVGLAEVTHLAPSSVGLDTIYHSKGRIPESFLRGCGVPEGFITQMRALVGAEDGIQFYSCFISYSGKDEEFATRLHGKMRDAHLRVWFAPEDIKGGEKLDEQLETQIRLFDKLLLVLSENSLKSPWVMRELRKACKAEREARESGRPKRKLFPVRLCSFKALEDWVCHDSHSGADLAEEVRRYFIPDFSHWEEHRPFEASFAKLLKDLQAEPEKP